MGTPFVMGIIFVSLTPFLRILFLFVFVVSAIELVGPSWRTHVALLANVCYSITLCLLGVVVWLVQDWRQMSLATSVPFLAYFFYWW
jgi:hypothetical protein